MKTKNKAAVRLGRMARGKPKRYSPEELAKRTARLKAWCKAHPKPKPEEIIL